jgi:integrase
MGTVYKRGTVWWCKYYRNGKPFFETSGSTRKTDAVRLLKDREGDIVKGVPVTPQVNRVTLGELYQDVVTDYVVNKKKTLNDMKRRFQNHMLPFFGEDRKAASISTTDIKKYISHRLKKGASNGGINRELTCLRRAFTLAVRCEPPKLLRKPHIQMLKENNVRKGFFELDQYQSVVRHLPFYLKNLIRFFFVTGWRKSEGRSLQWRLVDFKNEWVSLEPGTTKNDEGRTFPFTDELRELLYDQRRYTDEVEKKRGIIVPWVFHNKGKPIGDFRKAWKTACEKAGVPGRIPHDFRRTAVRNLVRAGIPERVAMQMTGHKTRSVFERYNIVSERDLKDAARLLNGYKMVTVSPSLSKGGSVSPLESIARP